MLPKKLLLAALLMTVAGPTATWAAEDLASRLANASAEQGKLAFHTCGACHTVEQGGPTRVGPNLWDVVGRAIASVDGYDYSDALRGLEGDWTFKRLDEFLAAPMDYTPGTRMVYPGVKDAATRAAVIRYLHSLSDSPVALPEAAPAAAGTQQAAADPFGEDWPQGPGRDLTGFACQACHSLAIVKQQGLSRKRWDKLLEWMVEEQGMDPLVPSEHELVLDYLSTHFGSDG